MEADLLHLVDCWSSLTVLVIGDVMLDCYLNGTTNRLCQEAPVPVVAVSQRQNYPGGAANVAANVASLGANVRLLSVIGDDHEGDRLRQALAARQVATADLLVTPTRTTLAKQRVMAADQVLVRFDQGSTEAIAPDLEDWVIERLTAEYAACDAVIVSDYGYGILTPRIIQRLATLQAQHPRVLAVDSKQLPAYQSVGMTLAKPNYVEATQVLGIPKRVDQRVEQILACGNYLLEMIGADTVAVTLDAEGAVVLLSGQPPIRTVAQPVPAQQTSGAGDTYISAFTLGLATGATVSTAATLAATATGVVVQQVGTTLCSATALVHAFEAQAYPAHPRKILSDRATLSDCVQRLHQQGQRIVLTNGCFDILHAGHVAYLTQAKALGDVLIVGVNVDETVRQLKGSDRPVNPLADRLAVLAALGCVDYVVPFAELMPHALIRAICPTVFVKGGDYTRETLPEAELVEVLGGRVEILPYVRDRSTTRLIHRIQTANPLKNLSPL
ncbi:D-glycero-beta-D-manno-heptose 1-phosphate adenylyltransferase [Oscillatoria sp. FACHB-1407]|uniref:D-glycero-beta-D-manno-heptose 1-phosphate adenylyltransferase n=1 Tax=Oscillatoria sp. FACHB-1407 TaxID=2692847 RepID=UPI001683894A|nr:D-glycero-beta-D-manno-heptose 1-phosphate adenylyltransferase [Oscillatoria sp. FACHB-1407]MBD2460889.1 D-glycero-beta-D-manno-heptose 1-phosphate adenylyltransferase [Oscillatoria sp. FACHB-1407]